MNFDLKLGKAASVLFLALAMAGCGGGGSETTTPEPDPMPDPAIQERAAIASAIGTANAAVAAVDNDSTDAEVGAADDAIAAARSAIAAASHVPEEELAANTGTVEVLDSRLTAAKTARTTAMNDAANAAAAAMIARAMKLHGAIVAPNSTAGAGERSAAYDAEGNIQVTIGSSVTHALSEDDDAVVAANRDWEGMSWASTLVDTANGGTYEAVVYSNVGEPTEGAMFNVEYTLDSDDQIADVTSVTDYAGLVASPSFDQDAGSKSFELPDNTVAVKIDGTFHGVAGTYSCTPGTGTDCTAAVAASGFTLSGGTWAFEPTDPEARLMDVQDNIYASYGWWRFTHDDGTEYVSAFAANKGAVPAAAGLDTLNGTATYMGGAAGQYALHSTTGGTNDAGDFTADATLEANFTDNTITGTIDNFMGADGEARDWSVELKESAVAATGEISRAGADDTVWTIGETADDASGEWSGTLYDNGDDGVPTVATGTFYSEYGRDGRMVGAFGANKQ